jgi:endogenous inhibitor of DNA gyrase (YacG/DUF329 family)
MKDWYMVLVLAAVIVTPFLPLILKGKCPKCGKRKLEPLESAEAVGKSANPYIAYFSCSACQSHFMRDKSGPMRPLEQESPVSISPV